MSLRSLNIAPRALLGFSLIGLLMLGLGVFSLVQMGQIRQAGLTIERINVPSIQLLDELTANNLRLRTLSYRLLVNREAQDETLHLMDERNQQSTRESERMIGSIQGAPSRSWRPCAPAPNGPSRA